MLCDACEVWMLIFQMPLLLIGSWPLGRMLITLAFLQRGVLQSLRPQVETLDAGGSRPTLEMPCSRLLSIWEIFPIGHIKSKDAWPLNKDLCKSPGDENCGRSCLLVCHWFLQLLSTLDSQQNQHESADSKDDRESYPVIPLPKMFWLHLEDRHVKKTLNVCSLW